MVKNKVRRSKRNRNNPMRKTRCAGCHKRVSSFHECSGKTKENKRLEKE